MNNYPGENVCKIEPADTSTEKHYLLFEEPLQCFSLEYFFGTVIKSKNDFLCDEVVTINLIDFNLDSLAD